MEYVYKVLPEEVKEEIFTMWDAYTPLSKELQKERINQIVYVIKSGGSVVGVSTAYLQSYKEKMYYFFRTFIHPDIRGQIGSGFPDIVRATNQRMQEVNDKEREAEGMVVITENKKLMRPGFRKLFRDGGWKYVKLSTKKQDIWFYPYPLNV